MAKRVLAEMPDAELPCVAAPATPSSEARLGASDEIANTPTKSQKRRRRMQRLTILKSQADVKTTQTATNNMFAFTGGVFSRLDRIEYMVSCLFCSMVSADVDQCTLPEQLPAMRVDAAPFVPAQKQASTLAWEPIPVPCTPVTDASGSLLVAAREHIGIQPAAHYMADDLEVTSEHSSASNKSDGDPVLAIVADEASSAASFDETILAMYELCSEEDGMGPYSRMSAASKARVQQIRSDLWDHFTLLCKLEGLDPTPESLSSSAGCLPSIFSDSEPDLTEFVKTVEGELSMM